MHGFGHYAFVAACALLAACGGGGDSVGGLQSPASTSSGAASTVADATRGNARALGLVEAAGLAIAAPTNAATYTVTTTADSGACAAGVVAPGCSLRKAILAANANPGSNQIRFNIPSTQPVTVQRVRYDGYSASFWSYSFDETGCIGTFVVATATKDRLAARPDGSLTRTDFASIGLERYDFCTAQILFAVNGVSEAGEVEIEFNHLNRARITGTLPYYDPFNTGAGRELYVDLEFDANGPVITDPEASTFGDGNYRISYQFMQKQRDATVNGVVSFGGVNYFDPSRVEGAMLTFSRVGIVEITREQ